MVRKILKVLVVLILSHAISGCAKDLVTGKKTYNLYSIDSESKIGSYVMKMQLKELKDNKKEYDSSKNKAQMKLIEKVVDDIAEVSHYPKFPYEVHLADIEIVNAWCAPGGKIMVYEGLWDPKKGLVKKGDKDELAAVLAHEIAHANARHITEAISLSMTILTMGQIASQIISSSSGVGGNIFQEIFSEGLNVFIPSYSRKNELEADRVGLVYMAKAGYDPRAAVRLWERAVKIKGDKTSLYATHPSSGVRAKELKKHLDEAMGYYEETKLKWKGKKKKKKPNDISLLSIG